MGRPAAAQGANPNESCASFALLELANSSSHDKATARGWGRIFNRNWGVSILCLLNIALRVSAQQAKHDLIPLVGSITFRNV